MGVYVVQLREILTSNKDLARKLTALERSLVALDLKTQRQFKEWAHSAAKRSGFLCHLRDQAAIRVAPV